MRIEPERKDLQALIALITKMLPSKSNEEIQIMAISEAQGKMDGEYVKMRSELLATISEQVKGIVSQANAAKV